MIDDDSMMVATRRRAAAGGFWRRHTFVRADIPLAWTGTGRVEQSEEDTSPWNRIRST